MAEPNLSEGMVNIVPQSDSMASSSSKSPLRVDDVMATSEASVTQILSNETVATSVSMSPDNMVVGTVLYRSEIDPSLLNTDSTSRIGYLSKLYRFWCGKILFRFVFTKTILQQMKILAVFVPGAKLSDAPPTASAGYFYSHKTLMNPANESEFTLSVPFVSTRPYHQIGESTGMVYVLCFQPVTVSVQDATQIHMTIFVAGDLHLHEFAIPTAVEGGVQPMDVGESWILMANNAGPAISSTQNNSTWSSFLRSDAGTTISWETAEYNQSFVAAGDVAPGVACFATPVFYDNTHVYEPEKEATITGTPVVGMSTSQSRLVLFTTKSVALGDSIGGFGNDRLVIGVLKYYASATTLSKHGTTGFTGAQYPTGTVHLFDSVNGETPDPAGTFQADMKIVLERLAYLESRTLERQASSDTVYSEGVVYQAHSSAMSDSELDYILARAQETILLPHFDFDGEDYFEKFPVVTPNEGLYDPSEETTALNAAQEALQALEQTEPVFREERRIVPTEANWVPNSPIHWVGLCNTEFRAMYIAANEMFLQAVQSGWNCVAIWNELYNQNFGENLVLAVPLAISGYVLGESDMFRAWRGLVLSFGLDVFASAEFVPETGEVQYEVTFHRGGMTVSHICTGAAIIADPCQLVSCLVQLCQQLCNQGEEELTPRISSMFLTAQEEAVRLRTVLSAEQSYAAWGYDHHPRLVRDQVGIYANSPMTLANELPPRRVHLDPAVIW